MVLIGWKRGVGVGVKVEVQCYGPADVQGKFPNKRLPEVLKIKHNVGPKGCNFVCTHTEIHFF